MDVRCCLVSHFSFLLRHMANPVLCPAGVRFDHHRHCSEINQHFHNVPPTRAGHFLLRYHQLSGIRGVVSRNPTGGQSLHGCREQINVCGTGVCDSVWSYLHFLQPCALLLLLLGHLQQLDRTALSKGHANAMKFGLNIVWLYGVCLSTLVSKQDLVQNRSSKPQANDLTGHARCPHCHDRCWTRTCGCRHSILRNELECMCGTSTYCCFVHIPFRVVFTLLGCSVCVCVLVSKSEDDPLLDRNNTVVCRCWC